MEAAKRPLHLFYCYAREDKAFRDELDIHLSGLKRQNLLMTWSDREIRPGEEWETAIDFHLKNAHLILLLISPLFLASEYCYGKEMQQALERHKQGTARVIPILIRPTDWEDAPFSSLQMLPSDALPVTLWPNRDAAWWDVAKGIRAVLKDPLLSFKTKEEWLQEGFTFAQRKQAMEALAAFEQALRLDPNFADAYNNKGNALSDLKRYEEAQQAYQRARQLGYNG